MTPEQLAEIKADLAAITPGPWTSDDTDPSIWSDAVIIMGHYTAHDDFDTDCWADGAPIDRAFIAKAPERIATLVSEVEKLRKVVDFYDGKTGVDAWGKVGDLDWSVEREQEFERLQDVEQEHYKTVDALQISRNTVESLKRESERWRKDCEELTSVSKALVASFPGKKVTVTEEIRRQARGTLVWYQVGDLLAHNVTIELRDI